MENCCEITAEHVYCKCGTPLFLFPIDQPTPPKAVFAMSAAEWHHHRWSRNTYHQVIAQDKSVLREGCHTGDPYPPL